MPIYELEGYVKTLRDWVNATGLPQKRLAKLTAHFHLDPDRGTSQPLSEDRFSRTVKPKGLPTRPEAVINLLMVLGVLYSLNVVTKADIEAFLIKYGVNIPDNQSLDSIWPKIEEGRIQLQETAVTTTSQLVTPTPPDVPWKKNPLVWTGLGVFLIFLAFLFVARGNGITPSTKVVISQTPSAIPPTSTFISTSTPISTLTPIPTEAPNLTQIACNEPILKSDPSFLPDQGYSLYEVSTTGSSIISNHIRSIGLNKQGLWVGYIPTETEINRVSQYNREKWIHYCFEQELAPGQVVNGFAFDDNMVYIATDGAGIGQFNGAAWAFYTKRDGLLSDAIYELSVRDGIIWATTHEGVAYLDGSNWVTKYRAKKDELASNAIHTYLRDQKGTEWFGTINHGVSYRNADGEWKSDYVDDLYKRNIRRMAEDNKGGIWIATDGGGILYYSAGVWRSFSLASGQLPSDRVDDIEKDLLGRIWAATSAGLVYTSDYGQTWVTHSTLPVLDVEFGCKDCTYEENHMWLVVKDIGLGHVRIPPLNPTVRWVSLPKRVKLKPGEQYIFEVTVEVIAEQLTPNDGDALKSTLPNNSPLYGAPPVIAVVEDVQPGGRYTFSNVDSPIIAPDIPGIYQLPWRIWQGRRFSTEPIIVEFEVVEK